MGITINDNKMKNTKSDKDSDFIHYERYALVLDDCLLYNNSGHESVFHDRKSAQKVSKMIPGSEVVKCVVTFVDTFAPKKKAAKKAKK